MSAASTIAQDAVVQTSPIDTSELLSIPRLSCQGRGWNEPSGVIVDTHVKRLRAKLGAHGGRIETVRGLGYRLARGDEA